MFHFISFSISAICLKFYLLDFQCLKVIISKNLTLWIRIVIISLSISLSLCVLCGSLSICLSFCHSMMCSKCFRNLGNFVWKLVKMGVFLSRCEIFHPSVKFSISGSKQFKSFRNFLKLSRYAQLIRPTRMLL